ncbi:glutamate-5-semialdehyde dehydrogenase [Aliikangiella sp. IMCC44359]|uniref:glutamate-5-semialdehyde dehydrogenase n=1 Tax=Aliikangiella sp. IMCC44359 TaxID=3459125 RepID=UPI00403AAB05
MTNTNLELTRQACLETQLSAKKLALYTTENKNKVLLSMANCLKENSLALLKANQQDVDNAIKQGLSDAMIDRLRLTEQTIAQMQQALVYVAELDDPLIEKFPVNERPNGIKVTKKRIPLGVILMIYESRPNVTVEAAALAIKSGNGIILRGGKEAFQSNQAIARCWQRALTENGLNGETVRVLESTDRELMNQLLKLDEHIDVVIPRGGEGLIRHVVANSYIPVIKHYKGVCHLYVDESADLTMALELLINGKVQRPGVCNALEGLIVHKNIAETFLPMLAKLLTEKNVIIYGCEKSCHILPEIQLATESEFLAEFLDLKISMSIVDGIEQAIEFIDRYGSGHTEVIVTQSSSAAEKFINEVDASVVMVNASSRFSDGGELGLGAEIGISTSKIHAYGPMGLESLTSQKFVVNGEGQIR